MDWKACLRLSGEVSVGKVSTTLPGEVCWRLERTLSRLSWRRARRATARLPCLGCERMRAIPVPWRGESQRCELKGPERGEFFEFHFIHFD